MRALRLSVLLVACADRWRCCSRPRPQPVKIRIGWIVAPASMVPLLFLKPEHRQASRQILHVRADPFRLLDAADHRHQPGRDRHRGLRLHQFPAGDPERRPERSAHHRRRDPGRRARLLLDALFRAQGFRHQQDRGHEGQGRRDQRARQRRRHRHAHGAAPARARGEARLHHDRGAVPGPQGDAQGAQGRSGRGRAAVLLRSGAERFRQAAVHHAVELSAASRCRSGRRARASSTRTAPRWSICWKTTAPSCAGTTIRPTTRRRWR